MLNKCVIFMEVIVIAFVFQCLFIFVSGVDTGSDSKPARTSHDEKPANPPSSVKNNNTAPISPPPNGGENVNQTSSLISNDTSYGFLPNDGKLNPGAVLRGFYVFVGLGAIVVMYIVVRTIRLRRKKTTVRKYGILASREDVEMTPLGAEDEDEDTTLFDVNNHSRP